MQQPAFPGESRVSLLPSQQPIKRYRGDPFKFLFGLWDHSIFLGSALCCRSNRSQYEPVERITVPAAVYRNGCPTEEDTRSPGIYINYKLKIETA